LRRLRENVRRRRPDLGCEETWLFMMTTYTFYITQQFLAKHKMTVIHHPPYSPDLTPCDFFLFSKMKLKLK
jgi:histone-lysine N-methyltransferase SETMAR